MNKKTRKKMLVGGVVATLSFLPGCIDRFKSDGEQAVTESRTAAESVPMTGDVLVTMKGTPAITTDSLEKEKEKLLKANPQLRQALAFMDSREVDRNILEGLINQKLVDEYIVSNKINETAAYTAELRDLCESMERMLNSKFFSEQKAVTVPEAEVKSFYELNKDKIQGLTVSQGGVAATGIEFADGAAARAFAARVKTSPGGFKKVAQDDGLTAKIRDFKLVHNQSIGIDEKLRDKIAAIKTVPSIEIIEVNGMFWVVNATAKEEPKYIPYEQIKDRLKEQLEQNKRVEIFTKEIEGLKKEYAVEVNEEYFKPEQAQQQMLTVNGDMASAPAVEKKEAVAKRLA
jgi:hypothetical protein